MEAIERFLSVSDGYGYGDCDGSGDGYGSGSGDGSGDGYGSGSGDGYGYGDGSGYGYGSGSGSGVKSINGKTVYMIDDVQTIIDHIHTNYAKGSILNKDLTQTDCYIAKVDDYFAHSKTLKEAFADAQKKALQNMSVEDRIKMFLQKFLPNKKYPAKDFFEWHGILTGSCKFGRQSFVENNEINMTASYTIAEFIQLTKNAYGGDVIKQIKI